MTISDPKFTATSREQVLRVAIPGDLTSTTVAEARVALLAAIERLEEQSSGPRVLHIELTGARMIDSVGLNTLVGVVKRMRAMEGEVVVEIAHPSVERILTFTRLTALIRLERRA